MAEVKVPANDGKERSRLRGHQEQQIEEIGNGDGCTVRFPRERFLQQLASPGVHRCRRDGKMRMTHGSLPIQNELTLELQLPCVVFSRLKVLVSEGGRLSLA